MKNFKPYLWVLYPILVFLIILVSLTWFAGGAGEIINTLNSKNQKVQQELAKRNNMQTKLAILKSLDEKTQLEKLKTLGLSLPITNQPWVLLSQAKTVGVVTAFRNTSTGKSTTLEIEASNSDALVEILNKIDALRPLVSINSLQLGSGKVKLDVVSHWETLAKLTIALEDPLPNLTK
jgi:hypothetical protein